MCNIGNINRRKTHPGDTNKLDHSTCAKNGIPLDLTTLYNRHTSPILRPDKLVLMYESNTLTALACAKIPIAYDGKMHAIRVCNVLVINSIVI